jgi:hypothetical protein
MDGHVETWASFTQVRKRKPSPMTGRVAINWLHPRCAGKPPPNVAYRTGPTRPTGARIGPEGRLDRTLWDKELTYHSGGLGELRAELVVWNGPLNFHVPGWYLRRGHMVVTVRLWLVNAPHVAKVTSERIHLLDVRPPRIGLVRVKMLPNVV